MFRKLLPLALLALSACSAQTLPLPAARLPMNLSVQRAPIQTQAMVTITPQEAHDWLADPNAQWLVLDVRTPEEFAQGHLTGATLKNFYDTNFKAQLEQMNRHQPTILYCRSGNRSGQTMTMMRELGFRNVYEIKGGIMAWQAAGFSVVK
ncbi:rhodanese-like domain-containing protein [bacterium (Candidatus Blackallbacteria) CG17_big_fil_post_rev_8_21_14_2_50_48_46]|uniref:Rhodanese-like domain-containing protein n=1 Tax=bacterium (Candidatus Blackallbacteria) CG17_big_fil_post_rev_8_21_14_2_50_48_46 TaxID=2014261 RepID=A0A2M7G9N3_9BACT|nr:MAG: sulfurtransferase [bacterium (Candidatus Blackallbacteria) CG18_big_fil_WC_8_21_14_2_50_49_26]PIW18830.1 MAG: rhodanese-like domain-containing protein [bacterium (Candidatus Blackallbacteria) CG17_big_fil_post_rev_8_21_14_2_50_48_46]PIW49285.1 MAG: rhodanese-like domain-containing protein [bacterium (Candidatus Blackallbacteria) CG13_big_fil_rev_8_21_14_2_50_49_14]